MKMARTWLLMNAMCLLSCASSAAASSPIGIGSDSPAAPRTDLHALVNDYQSPCVPTRVKQHERRGTLHSQYCRCSRRQTSCRDASDCAVLWGKQ